jgi:hypothetical protein
LFIQHKQLQNLNLSPEKIVRLHVASSNVQLAFTGFSPQLCSAYLLQIKGGDKVLVVVAFYLIESRRSIVFLPKYGEVASSDAEQVYEDGFNFIESMGFVLTETDYHLFPADKKASYWTSLPICRSPESKSARQEEPQPGPKNADETVEEQLQRLARDSRESLGRFLVSM